MKHTKKVGLYTAICIVVVVFIGVQVANAPAKAPASEAATTQTAITPVAAPTKPAQRTVYYSVETRGTISANIRQFKHVALTTLNNPQGWTRLGVVFKEVDTGGDFILVLAEAAQVPSFDPLVCGTDYSCQVGDYVIINQDRWLGATAPWNAAGGTITNYRHMVINHETGHWLGHPHVFCSANGTKAPVMQQQSINLQGCVFNPWPLSSELWSTKLDIPLRS